MYYVTKYALTDGIWEIDPAAAECNESEGGYLNVRAELGLAIQVSPKDWFTQKAAAVERVESMRAARLKSLEKSDRKVRQLDATYSRPWPSKGTK